MEDRNQLVVVLGGQAVHECDQHWEKGERQRRDGVGGVASFWRTGNEGDKPDSDRGKREIRAQGTMRGHFPSEEGGEVRLVFKARCVDNVCQ